MLKRIISLLLCVVMVVTMLPIQSAATEAETYINLLEATETTEEDTVPAETTEPEETSGPTENPEPEGTIEPEAEEQNCTGLLDCPAENHNDSCEKKLADEKNTADKAAADAVLAQIAELPTLKEIQEKTMAEQIADYGQVQEVYSQYGMLSAEQQSLLPPAEELFKHYFDYFNSLVSLVWSGSGTSSSPFLISNEQELRSLAQQVAAGNTYSGKYFRLSQSVALTSAWTPIGTESYPFRGTFDGNGNTVSGMTASGDYIGLFGYVGSGAVLKNLTLTEISMNGIYYVAGLAAYVDAGSGAVTISNCHVSGTAHGEGEDDEGDEYGKYTGGIAAYVDATEGTVTIENCTMSGRCSGDTYVGGMIGYGEASGRKLTVRNCINRAGIPTGSNSDGCGGIAGSISGASVISCMNYGSVSGNAYSEDNGSSWLGGITGYASSCQFTACGNYGGISTFFAGGIAASNSGCTFTDCLNTGTLTHSSDGYGNGIGYTYSNNVYTNCFTVAGRITDGISKVTSAQLASGEVAHSLREYFGQTIGTDAWPVPLTSGNRVYKVTVIGEVNGTYYANYGATVSLPEMSSCAAFFDGDSKFDPETPITRDYALAAKGYHNYVDGVCIYCGNEGVDYLDVGSCGESVAWTLTADGVLKISGTGAMLSYSASSPAPWNTYLSSIQTVEIGDGVTVIGDYAFKGLSNVTAVTMANTVTDIGKFAFNSMTGLTQITIADSVTSIGDYAFGSCGGLTSVSLGKGLKTIGRYAFYLNESLEGVSIPASTTTLGHSAFLGCKALTYIGLGGLTTIGSYALSETGLTDLSIPATVTQIDDYAFANNRAMVRVTFAGAAPQISASAFWGDTALCLTPAYDSSWESKVNYNYGGSLTWAIGSGDCGYYSGTVIWNLDFDGTLTISGSGDMYSFSLSYGSSTAPWASVREYIQTVVVCDGVTSIGDYAFYECTNLSSVILADSVTKIGTGKYTGYGYGNCFYNCTSLTQITIPKNVTEIAHSAFYGCSNLTAIDVASGNTAFSSTNGVLYDRYQYTLYCYPAGKGDGFTIPSGVRTIAPYALGGCDGLTQITIPSAVTSIGTYAFVGCENLSRITFAGSAPTIANDAFDDVTATVNYPTSDTTWTASKMKDYYGILSWNAGSGSCGTSVQWQLTYRNASAALTISGTGAMNDYTRDTQPWKDHITTIKTVEVGSGVTYIGSYALCPGTSSDAETSLTTVTLADSVTSIGDCAFLFCGSLKTVTLGEGLQSIGEQAFSCTAITSIDFPNSLRTVGRYAFSSCYYLKSLAFGSNLQTIGYTAFANCTALESVDLGTSVTTLEQSAFNSCSRLTKMVIPASVTSVGTYAFRNCTNLQYVEFKGNAPTFNTNAFSGTTCNAYYLSSKTGWTASGKLSNYGGTVTWGAISQRGTCGSKAEWILDTAGNLYICGSGSMYDYSATANAPWYAYRSSIKKVTLRGVTSIGNYAFNGCSALSIVSVPSTVSFVGNYAFVGCADLQAVIFAGEDPGFGTEAFSGITCEAWYPTSGYWSSSSRKDYGGSVTWRSTTATGTCGTNAWWALDSAGTLVVLGTGAITAYSSTAYPWYGSKASITSAIVGGEITNVSSYAFYGYTALQTATIGETVTSVNSYAFSGCSALNTITFLGSAPSITSNAFNSVVATAQYPLANTTWTTSKRQNYGGTITWEAVCTSHQETVSSAVAATCTTAGLTEGSYCSLCNEVLVAQEVIPAKGHFVLGPDNTAVPADTIAADCVKTYYCTVCKGVAIEAAGHRVLGTTLVETDPLAISSTSFTLTDDTYYSTNKSNNSVSTLRITAKYACTLTLNYGVSSEENYDELIVLLNSTEKDRISGEVADKSMTLSLAAGDVVKVSYDKDSSEHDGQNRGWVTLTYDFVMAEGIGDVPADTAEPDCTNAVVCRYCQTVIKEALGHRVIVQLPEPETPYEVANTSAEPFVLTDGIYYSANHGASSSSEIQLLVKADCVLTLHYGVSSESYDKLYILLNGTAKDTIAGVVAEKTMTLETVSGDVVTVRYKKDSSVNQNEDRGWVSVAFRCGPTEEIVPADSLEAGCYDIICDYCQEVAKEALDHNWDAGVEKIPATETTEGEMFHTCLRCGETKTEVIPVLEHVHGYEAVVTAPTCMEQGYTTHTCRCGDSYVDSYVDATGHTEVVDAGIPATCTEDGLTEGKHCSVCEEVLIAQEILPKEGHLWQNNVCSNCGAERMWRIDLNSVVPEDTNTVWIDGVQYKIQSEGENVYIDLPANVEATNMVTYSYHIGDPDDVHAQYPTSMKVWTLQKQEDDRCTLTRVEELDDILQYSGSSIRVTGKQGIRMITSIDTAKKSALTADGLAGYTLKEYGTVVAWADKLDGNHPLVLGKSYAKSNYAYKKDVADPVFAYDGDRMQYTNVLVGFSNEQCKKDLAMRPYMILEDAEGSEITLYGGIVQRSIGYIAYQNRQAFDSGTEAYEYVWDIIHSVYGTVYDDEYTA